MLGVRIASMRGYRRMSQEQLGKRVGVTKQTISGWENERRVPDADAIVKLCAALDCSANYLLGLSDNIGGRAE